MQMTTEARAWLDAAVRRILARHPLGDAERAGITYELMSHLHAAGEARATAAGRTEVSREDLEVALAEAGGEAGLAQAFVQPLAKPEERVLFWRRLGALAVDAIVLGVVLTFVHSVITLLASPLLRGTAPEAYDDSFWGLMPWGYHDAAFPIAAQALIAAASAAVALGYFTWFEGREGRSLGKRAFELRVLRTDGQPMTYREALIRNLLKLSPPLLVLETVIMLLVSREAKRRISDMIAGTIVVKA